MCGITPPYITLTFWRGHGMIDGIITKRCSSCKLFKSVYQFHRANKRPDGWQTRCRECFSTDPKRLEYKRQYRTSDRGRTTRNAYRKTTKGRAIDRRHQEKYSNKYPEKRKAKDTVHNAVMAGRMSHISAHLCHHCGVQAEQYHHPSYSPQHRLWGVPLCRSCHQECHAQG